MPMYSEILEKIAREIIHETYPRHLEVGMVTQHPEDGRIIYITKGEFLDSTYGRFSNFWHWREVLPDGSLCEKEEHGYGWVDPCIVPAEVQTIVKVIVKHAN